MIRPLLIFVCLSSLLAGLAACTEKEPPAVDVGLLATDIHVSVAQHDLVIPFVALDDYAYRKLSFSLDREQDNAQAAAALHDFQRDSKAPQKPLPLDGISIAVKTYGWDEGGPGQLCPRLTRDWARSVCDNPWAAIQQALPANRFRLVDLSRLRVDDPHGPVNCRDKGQAHRPLPQQAGEARIVCTAMVYGGPEDKFLSAAVRIEGDLGALWTVWRYGENGETVEAMTEREGKAIVAFVQYALGRQEVFSALHADMCRLRRPGSADHPHGADCVATAQPSIPPYLRENPSRPVSPTPAAPSQ